MAYLGNQARSTGKASLLGLGQGQLDQNPKRPNSKTSSAKAVNPSPSPETLDSKPKSLLPANAAQGRSKDLPPEFKENIARIQGFYMS